MQSGVVDRAVGTLLGAAVGDALGAPYEFGVAVVGPEGPRMIGGGLGDFAPGEWTDDTSMTWAVLAVAASADLRSDEALTQIAGHFRAWLETGPADIGNQTRAVLTQGGPDPTGAGLTAAAFDLHSRTGRSGGNGSLMRTSPVALPYLDDPAGLVDAARRVSALTHYDPQALDACVLWSLAIRHAILHEELDLRAGLVHLAPDAAVFWAERIAEAEEGPPGRFRPNGWVVAALQAAWSAIVHTPVPETDPASRHLADCLAVAIAIGDDTDTVASIAGALLGARYGTAAIRGEWRGILHGYPGLDDRGLAALAERAVRRH